MSSDDWGRIRPTKVDMNKMWKQSPNHRNCKLCIHTSEKNPMFLGLYCKQHNKLITWINEDQQKWLISIGIKD